MKLNLFVADNVSSTDQQNTSGHLMVSISLPVEEEILREVGCSLREISDQFERAREKRTVCSNFTF